jgi:hypothetical protein
MGLREERAVAHMTAHMTVQLAVQMMMMMLKRKEIVMISN